MDKLSVDDMKAVMKELEGATKCAGCSNLVNNPVTCASIHGSYCSACKLRLKICPTCSQSFTTSTAITVLKNMLKVMPRKCKNVANGCSRVMLPKAIENHQRLCSFREVPCRMECNWKGRADVLIHHIKASHTDTCIFSEISSVEWGNIKCDEDRSDISPVEAFDCFFWMYIKINKQNEKCQMFFVKVPTSEKNVETFYSDITYSKKKLLIKYQFVQKIFDEDVDTEQVFADVNCSSVPLSEIHNFIDEKGTLKGEFKIYREADLNVNTDSSDKIETNKSDKSEKDINIKCEEGKNDLNIDRMA